MKVLTKPVLVIHGGAGPFRQEMSERADGKSVATLSGVGSRMSKDRTYRDYAGTQMKPSLYISRSLLCTLGALAALVPVYGAQIEAANHHYLGPVTNYIFS